MNSIDGGFPAAILMPLEGFALTVDRAVAAKCSECHKLRDNSGDDQDLSIRVYCLP